jgi:hypothetical protein
MNPLNFMSIFFIIFAISITLLFFGHYNKDQFFLAFSMGNSTSSTFLDNSNHTESFNYKNDNKSSTVLPTHYEEKNDNCPPKPVPLLRDENFKSIYPELEPREIRIKVPTLANTGSLLILEGSGYIPLEKVRIELMIEWRSTSPNFENKTFIICKTVNTDRSGIFSTTLEIPESHMNTKGSGKYSIIGMDSRQEKNMTASFVPSKIGFSFRQEH